MIEGIFTAVGTLAVVIAVLFAAWWFTRKIAGGGRLGVQSRYMKVIDRIPVSQDKSIILVRVGDSIYMAGVASSGITLLATLREEDLETIAPQMDSPLGNVDFKELIQKIGGRKNHGN